MIEAKRLTKEDNKYSFTIIDSKKSHELKKIGKVFMYDKDKNMINHFIYNIHERNIYGFGLNMSKCTKQQRQY